MLIAATAMTGALFGSSTQILNNKPTDEWAFEELLWGLDLVQLDSNDVEFTVYMTDEKQCGSTIHIISPLMRMGWYFLNLGRHFAHMRCFKISLHRPVHRQRVKKGESATERMRTRDSSIWNRACHCSINTPRCVSGEAVVVMVWWWHLGPCLLIPSEAYGPNTLFRYPSEVPER